MKLIIPDTNIFARILLGFKHYEKLLKLVDKGMIKNPHPRRYTCRDALSPPKNKENELFGRVDRKRIPLSSEVREEVLRFEEKNR